MDGGSPGQRQSGIGRRSESKVLVGQKRATLDVEETSESSQKRIKIRDLESVFRSEAQAERGESSAALDLNVDVGSVNTVVGDDDPSLIGESNDLPTTEKAKEEHNDDVKKVRGLNVDLNEEDISSSINDPFYPSKHYGNLKLTDDLECGSSVGLWVEKDSMRVWKGLKQNNYMSVPHGAVPVPVPVPLPLPKRRGRKKSNNDVMKRTIELAKKEQVDRFARVAAPSGLLNGLNPGIINHVRNSKQVHSIIEALVRSERTESQLSGSKKGDQIKNDVQEPTARKEQGNIHGSGVNMSGISCGDAALGRPQMSDCNFFSKSMYANEVVRADIDLHKDQMRTSSRMPSQCSIGYGDDRLALKLSSSVTVATENNGCLSSDESADLGSVTSLSFKAANVASQWLELLSQDTRGRLAALRRSKKRVRAVITTELPLLISKEFSSYSKKDSCLLTKGSKAGHCDQASANAHSVRWSTLFLQMDKALSEEESHLENWLNQVKEMQLHCEKGLYVNSMHHSLQQTGPNWSDSRSRATDDAANDLAMRAAAASIYATCSFLRSTENLPCC